MTLYSQVCGGSGPDRSTNFAAEDTIDLAMQPGALDGKTKLLIALALDAFKGSEAGVDRWPGKPG